MVSDLIAFAVSLMSSCTAFLKSIRLLDVPVFYLLIAGSVFYVLFRVLLPHSD